MIETVEDIIEEIADSIGVYGAHDERCRTLKPCRCCWTSRLRERLEDAFKVQRILSQAEAEARGLGR